MTDVPFASSIAVQGARTHNLQEINVQIPLGSLSVITGVSGSGKSSLAFDTIYAEGQCRYLSSVSVQYRELLQRVDRPDVDFIDNLPPVLSVQQRLRGPNQRDTVATVSDLYDFLRLVYTRAGVLYCPSCGHAVRTQTFAEIVGLAAQAPERQKILILSPLVAADEQVAPEDLFRRIVKDGFVKARVAGQVVDAATPPPIDESARTAIEIVVDRLIMKEGIRSRLEESIALALSLGQGQCILSFETDGEWRDVRSLTVPLCQNCGTLLPDLEPQLFSFRSAAGACSRCHGRGILTGEGRDGLEDPPCPDCHGTRLGPIPRAVRVGGVRLPEFCQQSLTDARQILTLWGQQLERSSNPATVDSSPSENSLGGLSSIQRGALRHLLPEIAARLDFLLEIGLGYLTLDRAATTLSAGELQRTRLAACLGNQLTGVCYVLDEPTAGLHPRDTRRLLSILFRLRDQNNTVLLVEHDLEVIAAAHHVIDLGPGAGEFGGRVLAEGTPGELLRQPDSLTGKYLAARQQSTPLTPKKRNRSSRQNPDRTVSQPMLTLSGATLHNLRDVTLELPLQRLVAVTGASGSGKTSLILQTLVPAVRRALKVPTVAGGPFRELTGNESISRLIRVDQSPLGRSSRSNPATYSGLWDRVRQLFSKTRESRLRGFSPRLFSLGSSEGRCPRCGGRGELPIEGDRFSEWTVCCPECDGKRFSPTALSVRYRDKTVADVLDLRIHEAAGFFENLPLLAQPLNVFTELGLGYLKLGQSAASLSGGESQRVKLGTELAKSGPVSNSTLFVLDEPSLGLHAADVDRLTQVLKELASRGNSVVVIEHNQELIAAADWIIEIGPGAGPEGGSIVSTGPPSP